MNVEQDSTALNESNGEYQMFIKELPDIIEELDITEDDSLLTKSIILNLEKNIAEAIKQGNITSIPNIGRIRKNPVKQGMSKHYAEFKIARKHMDKETYKDYVKSVFRELKTEDAKKRADKMIVKQLKSKNKNKYEKLVANLGFGYANMWVKSILLLEEVPFNQDIQDAFDRLKDK